MTQVEEIAKLQAECANLQRQVVELRMQLDQQAQTNAALLQHAVSVAVDAKTGGRMMTAAQYEWVRDGEAAAGERKKARNAILLHVAQWGVGLSIAFIAMSVFDRVKAALGIKP